MLEVQREAIVAEAAAASQSLIGRELESLSNYLNAIGTQAAVLEPSGSTVRQIWWTL